MVVIALSLLLVALTIVVLRLVIGPSIYDRILSMNLFGTLVIALLAMLSWLMQDATILDIALTYGLMNFIATIAILRYFREGSFAKASEE